MSVAILAGGQSNRFQQPKPLAMVAGKPLILHTVEACQAHASEIFLVVHTKEARTELAEYYPIDQIIVDVMPEPTCPLVGALTAFKHARYPYTQLLPCDSPLIHPIFFEILWSMVEGYAAAVPRWPNGWIEPLHSVFHTETAAQVAEQCLARNEIRMYALISALHRVIYLSTNALQRFDPKLHTFINVNSLVDLQKLKKILGRKERYKAR
ncbi:MAG: molybdenum cofactor guanylyltransferase [Promethearchaeota archaeon]